MINKKINDITVDDINSLVENSVCESKTLDYKKELHIDSDSDKKEFLADISSFANSTGGDIIFGIEEDSIDKIPTNIVGIPYENEDKLIRRIEDFIRQSIQPIILNIEYKVIELKKDNCILIIRIPQSLISPHRIEYKGHNKFFTRNNKGKYQMDVSELRIAFNSGLDLEKRIEEYKQERYYQLLSNRYKNLIDDLPIFVVHYIPISALNGNNFKLLSQTKIKNEMNNCSSKALGVGYEKNISIDSVSIRYNDGSTSAIANYKTNGIIEKGSTEFFKKQYKFTDISPNKTIDYISGYRIIDRLIKDFDEVKRFYKKVEIDTPILVCCSILNSSNYTIPTNMFHDVLNKIDRDMLYINNLYVEDFNKTTEEILKPIFDSIWNACGYERCPAYDENEKYIGLNIMTY